MISIYIQTPHTETLIAINLLNRLFKINKIKASLSIVYDYSLEYRGIYFLNNKNEVVVNPINCADLSTGGTDIEQKFYYGYSNDISLVSVILHESCHWLSHKIYKTIVDDFAQAFPTTRLYLNNYSAEPDYAEEITEIMTLYLTNPFLLKMISKEHYEFLKKYFKSPTPTTQNKCFLIYSNWPAEVKTQLGTKWGIYYNIDKNKFEKKEIIKEVINSK